MVGARLDIQGIAWVSLGNCMGNRGAWDGVVDVPLAGGTSREHQMARPDRAHIAIMCINAYSTEIAHRMPHGLSPSKSKKWIESNIF